MESCLHFLPSKFSVPPYIPVAIGFTALFGFYNVQRKMLQVLQTSQAPMCADGIERSLHWYGGAVRFTPKSGATYDAASATLNFEVFELFFGRVFCALGTEALV